MWKFSSFLAVLCATALCSCAVSRPGPCGSTFPLAQARCNFETQIVADSWRGPGGRAASRALLHRAL